MLERLQEQLLKIDGKGYKAYKNIQGSVYDVNSGQYYLHIDYVQGDPFASPSRIRIEIPNESFTISDQWLVTKHRRVATEDFMARQLGEVLRQMSFQRQGTGKSGLISVDEPGQEVLERTAVSVNEQRISCRLSIGLPAQGRRILGKQALHMFKQLLPQLIQRAIFQMPKNKLEEHLQLADEQQVIREYIAKNNLVAFVANGSILPRVSGINNRPLRNEAVVPFEAPSSLQVTIPLPHGGEVTGLGIPRGVTLIVGGGYHGKSTLLRAIERGVYNHVKEDGREYVLTDEHAFKIRAEDGRSVRGVNISPFISNLPLQKNTDRFSTDDASGSTSQAANIIEALEIGAKTLLIDEDTSATNFMIRDARMQQLVAKGKEPITPFVDKVRQLYEEHGVSTILVLGGSGDYFDVADYVILLDRYRPSDVTKEAKEVAKQYEQKREVEGGQSFGTMTERTILQKGFHINKGKKEKVDAKGLHTIMFGQQTIDLAFVEQLVDTSQTRALANMLRIIAKRYLNNEQPFREIVEQLYNDMEREGLEMLSPFNGQHPGDFALPRPLELAAAINRLRTLTVKQK